MTTVLAANFSAEAAFKSSYFVFFAIDKNQLIVVKAVENVEKSADLLNIKIFSISRLWKSCGKIPSLFWKVFILSIYK